MMPHSQFHIESIRVVNMILADHFIDQLHCGVSGMAERNFKDQPLARCDTVNIIVMAACI